VPAEHLPAHVSLLAAFGLTNCEGKGGESERKRERGCGRERESERARERERDREREREGEREREREGEAADGVWSATECGHVAWGRSDRCTGARSSATPLGRATILKQTVQSGSARQI